MTLQLYAGVADNVKIRLSSAVAENHTVTFEAPPGVTINSGGTLVFTPANANTDQNLNITVSAPGTKVIPYTVTSPYTQRTKTGSVIVTVQAEAVNFTQMNSYIGAPPAGAFQPSQRMRFGVLNIASTSAAAYGKSFTIRVKAGQSLTGSLAFAVIRNGSDVFASGASGVALNTTLANTGTFHVAAEHSVQFGDSTTDMGSIIVECVNNFTGGIVEMSVQRAYYSGEAGQTITLNGCGAAPTTANYTNVPVVSAFRGFTIDTGTQVVSNGTGNLYLAGGWTHTPKSDGTADLLLNISNYSGTFGGSPTGTGFQDFYLGAKFVYTDGSGTSTDPFLALHRFVANSA